MIIYTAMRTVLELGHRPQGIICLNDRHASGVYRALAERGLRVPGDVSIASFDDNDIALYLKPQLTTAALPMSRWAPLPSDLSSTRPRNPKFPSPSTTCAPTPQRQGVLVGGIPTYPLRSRV